jgi:hypothetical protein
VSRNIIKIVLFIITLLLITTSLACSARPTNADEITRNLLEAVNTHDYNRYISYYAGYISWGIGSGHDFNAEVAAIKDRLGECEIDSLEYWKTEKEDYIINVFYKAKFTKAKEVTVKSVFREFIGTTHLFGFWLNP